jgi:hypothetical protein
MDDLGFHFSQDLLTPPFLLCGQDEDLRLPGEKIQLVLRFGMNPAVHRQRPIEIDQDGVDFQGGLSGPQKKDHGFPWPP